MCNTEFSGAGKGKQGVCANKERKYDCAGKGEYEVCARENW